MTLRRHRVSPRGTNATASKEQQIRELALFRRCSAGELRLIARLTDEIDLPAGRLLARAGEKTRELVILLDGVAMGSSESGRTILLPGSCYGGFRYVPQPLRIETLTAVRLLIFAPRVLRSLIVCVPSIAPALTVWNSRVVPHEANRTRLWRGNVRTRVAHPVA